MMKKMLKMAVLGVLVTVVASCKKEELRKESNLSSAKIIVALKTDNAFAIKDSLNNINAAGNVYSIRMVNLYISNISIKRDDGFIYQTNKVYYVDPLINSKSFIELDSIPKGNYTELSFVVGLDSIKNIDYGLEATVDNLNMVWPTAMGGGYHFIKIEGHYLNASNIAKGYAIHLGKNKNLVYVKIPNNFSQQNVLHNYLLLFNINDVFSKHYVYNLNVDNNYTMSDAAAMTKIKNNMQNAFTIFQIN